MSSIRDLIKETKAFGLYPFVYSAETALPGAIIDRAPYYIVYGNIFSDDYATEGKNLLREFCKVDSEVAKPQEHAARIGEVLAQHTFTTKIEASISYANVAVDAALDVGVKYGSKMRIIPSGLVQLSYPHVNAHTLAAAFHQQALVAASTGTALGQLVKTMKERHHIIVTGPRAVDIAQFVVTARGLTMEFVTSSTFAGSLVAALEGLEGLTSPLKVTAIVGGASETTVTAVWRDEGKSIPVLWFPWRYAWTGSEFETVSL